MTPLKVDPFGNLDNCINDAYEAEKLEPEESSIPNDWRELLKQLNLARVTMPSEHRNGAADPFRETLLSMGPDGFAEVWSTTQQDDPVCNGFLMRDIAQALLQRAPTAAEYTADPSTKLAREQARERRQATDAFEEVVFDLYDSFLSPRWRLLRPNFSRLPPLVTWVSQNVGAPYSWDTSATLPFFGVECGVVTLPFGNAKQGLLSWAAIAHESSGHDVLSADAGMAAEIEEKLKESVSKLKGEKQPLGEYWLQRWDEAAADVMSILNIGPAAGIALLGYFQARRRARGEKPFLSCVDTDPDSTHPIDIMRAALWVAVIDTLPRLQELELDKEFSDAEKRLKETEEWRKATDKWKKKNEEERHKKLEADRKAIHALGKKLEPWANELATLAKKDLMVALNQYDPERDPKATPEDKKKPIEDAPIIKLKLSHAASSGFYTWTQAIETAATLLEVLDQPLDCLDKARLRNFCDWTPNDENAVDELCEFLIHPKFDERIHDLIKYRAELRYLRDYGSNMNEGRVESLRELLDLAWPSTAPTKSEAKGRWDMAGLWAAHVVAAAITVALRKPNGLNVATAFTRMKKLLALMHNYNHRWGPSQEMSLSEEPDEDN